MRKAQDALAGANIADAMAEQITLLRVDETGATPQPTSVAKLWVTPEYDELTHEQRALHAAAGVEQSREPAVEAAGLATAASSSEWLLDGHRVVVETVSATYVAVLAHLTPYRRRPPKAKTWHLFAKTAFLLGDLAGIATAAIWLGEIPAIAVIMALSAAAATVTAGISGTEVRDVRDRIRRGAMQSDLPDELSAYRYLFDASDRGWPHVKSLLLVSVAVAGIVACAIFALRASIEEPLVGLVFGGIAAAIAAASWIESFCYADAIADVIDNAEADHVRETERHQSLASNTMMQRHAESLATAASIQAEQAHRGVAAEHHMQALLYGIHRRNPQTAGNGPAVEPTTIGQTTRRGGAK